MRFGYNDLDRDLQQGRQIVARLSLYIMVVVLILLFAITFAVLGRGEYQPPAQNQADAYSVRLALMQAQ